MYLLIKLFRNMCYLVFHDLLFIFSNSFKHFQSLLHSLIKFTNLFEISLEIACILVSINLRLTREILSASSKSSTNLKSTLELRHSWNRTESDTSKIFKFCAHCTILPIIGSKIAGTLIP